MEKNREALKKLKNINFLLLVLWVVFITINKSQLFAANVIGILGKAMLIFFIVALAFGLKAFMNKENSEIKSDITVLMIIDIVMVVIISLGL